ncbi:MAG: galactose mutarotase [Minicystis sp.]
MHRVDRRDGPSPILTLSDSETDAVATVAPARGGMLIGFSVAGRELLYLDRGTFDDPRANVRGGVPVLFPSPGKLANDTWSAGGRSGSMKQHGFARNLPWEIVATGDDDGASATLGLGADEVTKAQYPWDFHALYTYRLRGRSIAVEMRVENHGDSPMPFGVGFHPYFLVRDADKASVQIPTRATRAFDNKDKREVPFGGFDLTAAEVDMHLHDHGGTEAALVMDDAEIVVSGSPELTHWVVWTLKGRDFVCLEPWSCPGNALNTGDRLLVLGPGEARSMWMRIALR